MGGMGGRGGGGMGVGVKGMGGGGWGWWGRGGLKASQKLLQPLMSSLAAFKLCHRHGGVSIATAERTVKRHQDRVALNQCRHHNLRQVLRNMR